MKRTEVALIAVIVLFSGMIAYAVGQALLGGVTQKGEAVKTIDAISSNVEQPDARVFNQAAKNPTVQVTIGSSSNKQPLDGGQ